MWRPRLRVGERGDGGTMALPRGGGGTMALPLGGRGDQGGPASASAFAAQEQDLLPTNNICEGL